MTTSLDWDFVSLGMNGVSGGECSEHRCRQFPRVTRLVQRPNKDEDWITTFHVDGLVNYYHSADEALAAMRAN
jgi:hypothetical protein